MHLKNVFMLYGWIPKLIYQKYNTEWSILTIILVFKFYTICIIQLKT